MSSHVIEINRTRTFDKPSQDLRLKVMRSIISDGVAAPATWRGNLPSGNSICANERKTILVG